MKDNETIIIKGVEYEYSEFYKTLKTTDPRKTPGVLCPECHNDTFQISYGNYECIAHCKCGHSMTIYDG